MVGAAGCTLMVGAAGCTLMVGAAGCGLVGAGGVLRLCQLALRARSSGFALAASQLALRAPGLFAQT